MKKTKMEKTSLLLLLAILVSLALPLPAVAQPPTVKREQTVIHNAWPVPTHFNPLAPGAGQALHHTYEWLFLFDDVNLKLIPWLAESAKWIDELTLEVKIRKEAHWQDGEPLTAEDVKYTFELGKKYPGIALAEPRVIWVYIDSIEMVDDYTLRFHLKPENPAKLALKSLLHCMILPKHIWEKIEKEYEDITEFKNIYPVGSGPYKVVYHDDTKIISERYDDWWGKDVPPSSENPYLGKLPEPKWLISLRVTCNEECARLLIAGDMDASQCFYPRVWEHFDEGIVTWFKSPPFLGPTPKRTGGYVFNLERYPINDSTVRKAIAFALDRTTIAERAFSMYATTVDITCIKPDSPLAFLRSDEAIAMLDLKYDPDYAKKLLDEANIIDRDGDGVREMPDGTPLVFKASVPEGWTDWMIALEMLASYLKDIGIKVETVYPDVASWKELIRAGDFDITNWQGSAWTATGVWDFYRNILDSRTPQYPMITGKSSRYNNTEVWSIIDEIAKYWDPFDPDVKDDLKKLYGELQKILARDLPMIPVWAWDNPISYQTKYWVGWPSEENPGPRVNVNGEPEFLIVLQMIRSATAPAPTVEYTHVWITKEVSAFIGVDGKSYGPFKEGEYVRIPEKDAERLIAKGVASYTPPVAPEVEEALTNIAKILGSVSESASSLRNSVNALSSSVDELSKSVASINTRIATLESMLYAVLAISIVAAILALAATLRAGKRT